MRHLKIPISLLFLLSLSYCTTSGTASFTQFKHPILVSKARFPGDKGSDSTLTDQESFKLKTYKKEDEFHREQGQNLTTSTKKAVRGVKKPYIQVKNISVEAHNYWYFENKSATIVFDSKVGSMENSEEVEK